MRIPPVCGPSAGLRRVARRRNLPSPECPLLLLGRAQSVPGRRPATTRVIPAHYSCGNNNSAVAYLP